MEKYGYLCAINGAVDVANGTVTRPVQDSNVTVTLTGTLTYTGTASATDSISDNVVTVSVSGSENETGTVRGWIEVADTGWQEDETPFAVTEAFEFVEGVADITAETDATEYTAGDNVTVTYTAEKADADGTVNNYFDSESTVTLTVTTATTTHLREVVFVDGVATVEVPVEAAGTGYTVSADLYDLTGVATDTFDVVAAEASALSTNASDQLILVDEYDNFADSYNAALDIATVTVNGGTFSGSLDTEDQMELKVVAGAVLNSSDAALTYAGGTSGDTITIDLANGDSFTYTVVQ